MDEQTNVATATNNEPIKFETNEFEEGDFKGFKFISPEYGNVSKAVETYGEAVVLSLLNAQITARIRTKVKNGLPKNLKPQELAAKQQELLQKYPGGVLFSTEDAEKWRPDVRELSPNQLFKKAKEAFAAGDLAEGQRLLLEMGKALQS